MEGVEALSEHSFPAPETAYGASKLAGEYIVRSYASEMFRPYIVRAFNHIGPGQGGDFVCPTLARKIVAAPDGGRITVGNLKVYRDFTDVRDVVRAYRLILEVKPAQDLFVIGSGRAVRIEEVLEELARISGKEITAEVDRSLVRNVDPPLLCADSSLAQHVLGWSPAIPMEQTLREVYGEAARLLPQHNGKARGGRPAAGC